MNRKISTLILLALSLTIYVGTAGWPALLDSTDAGHAEAAREMAQTGDWVILHINGIRYLEKPPLHYWLVAATYKLIGVSAFATRLPLALAVVGLVMMVYLLARHWFGENAGFYAGLIMCTAPGTYLFTRIMIPEAIYALEFTALFYLFLRGWQGTLPPRTAYWSASALLALATLTRSLVGLVFPCAIVSLFLLITGGWRRWRELHLFSSAAIFLAIALPWHITAILTTKHFLWFYFINEQVLRALGMRYPKDYDAVPLLVWWASHIVWFFPWSLFAPFSFRELPPMRAWRRTLSERSQAALFVFIWATFVLLFFSWTKSRMEYYSFGGWPAIAILLGVGISRAEDASERWLPRIQTAILAIGVLISLALGALLWISRGVGTTGDITALLHAQQASAYRLAMADFFDLTPQAFADLRAQCITTIVVLLLGFGVAWAFRRKGRGVAGNISMALTIAAFFFCANWALGVFEPRLSSRPLVAELNPYMRPQDQLALYGEYDAGSSIGFYTGRRLWIYNGRMTGLEFGSHYPDAPQIFLDDQSFPAFWRGAARVFLVIPSSVRDDALARLPADDSFFVTALGGKTVYANQPVYPNAATLADIRAGRARDAADGTKIVPATPLNPN